MAVEPLAEQLRTGEELARRLAAGEELEAGDGRQEQIQADEQLARALSDEQEEQVRYTHSRSRLDPAMGERAAQALEVLAPLRQRSEASTLLDTVFAELESLVRQVNGNDTNAGMGPGVSELSISASAGVGSDTGITIGEASAPAAPAAPAVPALPAAPATQAESASNTAEATSASDVAGAAASRLEGRVSGRIQTESALMSDRLVDYMAGAQARRAEQRRRREERLRALNALLDVHMQAGLAGLEVPSAGAAQEMIDSHTVASTWSTGPPGAQCVICVEDLTEGETIRRLPCGHVYHQECIDLWLQRSRLCCLCKRPIESS